MLSAMFFDSDATDESTDDASELRYKPPRQRPCFNSSDDACDESSEAARDVIALAALPFVSLSAPPEEVNAALLAMLNDVDQASAMQALDIVPQSIAKTLEKARAARCPLQRALYRAIDQNPRGERVIRVRVLTDGMSENIFQRDYCELSLTQTHLQMEYVMSGRHHGAPATMNPRQIDARVLLSRVSGAYADLTNADWSVSERKKLQLCVMLRPETWRFNFANRTTEQFIQIRLGVYRRDAAAIPAFDTALRHMGL